MSADTNPKPAPAVVRHPADPNTHLPSTRSSGSAGVWAGWVLLAGFTLLFGSVSLVYPFGRDQAAYAFMGNAMLHGMTLYRDIPVMLLPMAGLVHAFALALFGRTMAAIRILDVLWTLATAGVLSLLVAKVFRRPWLGVIAGLIYSFTYYSIEFWNTTQVDGFLNLPLVISMYLLAKGLYAGASSPQPSSRHAWASSGVWFVAGLLMGIALLFKYTIGLLVPGAVLVLIFAPGRPRAENWRAAAWFCGGCVLTGLVALLIFVLSGALSPFIRLQIGTTLPYSRMTDHRVNLWRALWTFFTHFPPSAFPSFLLGILGLIPALALLLAKRRKPTPTSALGAALILVWLVAAVASVLAQGKFLPYHYLPGLPPFAVLGALATAAALRPLAGHFASTGRRVGVVAIALAGIASATRYPARLVDLARVASNRLSLHDLWSRPEFSGGTFSVSENEALAEYLKEHTNPNDRVANFGDDPPFTLPAWREPVLRFATVTGFDPASWKLPPEFRAHPPNVLTVKRGERLLTRAWKASGSAYQQLMAFAFRHGEVSPYVLAGRLYPYEQLMAFTELHDLVAARYEFEARVGHFDVLRLMNSDSVMPVSGDSLRLLSEDLGEALDWLKARGASGRDSGLEGVRTILWPCRVPDNLDSGLSAKMVSHKSANRALWLEEKERDDLLPAWCVWIANREPDDLLPALSVWIANDDRPFARQDPFSRQGEGRDYDAGGLSFVVQHRCRNGIVFVYDVRRTRIP